MKRFVLVSLFLLAALLTSVAQAQAPAGEPINGEWLLRILERSHGLVRAGTTVATAQLTRQELADMYFVWGQLDGIGQALFELGLVCPADHWPSFEEEQQVVENGIRANPKVFFRADSASVIRALLQSNYPCNEKRPAQHH